jgi:hypothetical protein
MQKIKEFWVNSYTSDKTAFAFELVSFVFTVAASLTLAVTAREPNMMLVYPGFFIGALTGVYAYWRRGIAWPMVLTGYFAIVNIFGFGVAANWW